jgi:tetratricopeptide (TPR) repeat protein
MRRCVVAAWMIAAVVACARPAAAVELYSLEFLHRLQDVGYGDVAMEYIETLAKRSDLADDVRLLLDMERSKSLRVAAQNAYDNRLAEQYAADSRKYLDKFLKEHADHPLAGAAIVAWGDSDLERAQMLLGAARGAQDKAKATALHEEARTALLEARKRFDDAVKRFQAQLAKVGTAKSVKSLREELMLGALEARFKNAQISYFLGQTFEDPKDPERVKALKTAGKQFDAIYQEFRASENPACLYAHLWHGRVEADLGNIDLAMDIIDEIPVPDTGVGGEAVSSLGSLVELFRMRITAKKLKPAEFVAEGTKWLDTHKGWRKNANYQGVNVEVARAQLAIAADMPVSKRTTVLQRVAVNMANSAKIESEYRQEALALRLQALTALGSERLGVDEYLLMGDAELQDGKINEAEENYNKALERATEGKDQKKIAEVNLRLNRVRYSRALVLFKEKKYVESLAATRDILTGDSKDPSAANAAALALSIRLANYGSAPAAEREAALQKLEKMAEFVQGKFPNLPVADDARMTMAQARLMKGETDAAMALLQKVNAASKRYSTAQYFLGQLNWKAYVDEKRKEAAAKPDRLDQSRLKAQEHLQNALDAFQKELGAPGQPPAKTDEAGEQSERARSEQQYAEAQVLLAEVLLEGKEYEKATALLDPLIDKLKEADRKTIDKPTFRTFMAGVRAHMALGRTDRAAEIALVLVGLSEDDAMMNGTLVNFAKLLAQELKRGEAAVIDAQQGGNTQVYNAAVAKRDALKQLLIKVLDPLGQRQNHSLGDMVYLGDTCASLGLTDAARKQYEQILTRAKEDEEFGKAAVTVKAVVRVRAQLIGLLRASGQLEEAAKQADKLIEANKNALEPRMVKAYILEDWAKKDPAKFDAAVAQWTSIRLMLEKIKPRPPEYFEVIYKCAALLYTQYEKTKDKTKLSDAEKLLNATMVLNTKLTGPDMIAQYKALLKRIKAAQDKK